MEFINHVTHSSLTLRAQLKDCLDLVKKLNDEPYAFDRDGKLEFEMDLRELQTKISIAYNEILK